MFDATIKALVQMFSPEFRRVLLKSIGLGLILIVLIGIGLNRVFSWMAEGGAAWAEASTGGHTAWQILAWVLSVAATLGIITGALFLMPTIAAFVGTFFVDETAEAVEREYYPAEPLGRALPFFRAMIEGIKIALLTLAVYFFALPFIFFAGVGIIILFLANAYLLGREYFELAAMRFRPPFEAKAMRKANAVYVFLAGMVIAVFVSIPVVNLATPIFAMAFMVHVHKRMTGKRAELVEKPR
jgi:CysZ protein